MIRNSSKAILVHEGKILLNKCHHADGRIYYDLPGGGQRSDESMEECLCREVHEETGYRMKNIRPAAVAEEIYTDAELRKQYPEYCHRIIHLFVAVPEAENKDIPTELDWAMEKCEWIPIGQVAALPELLPNGLKENLEIILSEEKIRWLGTQYLAWNEP